MAKKKSWKDSFCDECDFCPDRSCRKVKPVQGRYPTVTGIGSNKFRTQACTDFKERPEKHTVKEKNE